MRVTHLDLTMFRNYRSLELEPAGRLNLLIGANAQGKTNLLEAISLVMRGRSSRIRLRQDILTRGEARCRVAARFESDQRVPHDVELSLLRTGSREVMLDGGKLERTSDLFDRLPSVLQETTDLEMLSGPPAVRRTFLDTVCLELSVSHVGRFSLYQKLLRSRNALLSRGRSGAEMETLELQMATAAADLVLSRLEGVDALRQELETLPPEDGSEELEIEYTVAGASGREPPRARDELIQWYLEELADGRESDLQLGYGTFGPHRDDLELKLGGKRIRNVASRGQMKDVLLRLKVAEAKALARLRGESPVMLLDDVFSETDSTRRRNMLRWLPREGQIFLSGTDERIEEELEDREWQGYRVRTGALVAA